MSSPDLCPDDKILQTYVAGNLSDQQCADLERHLQTCQHCNNHLDALEKRNTAFFL